MPIVQETVVTPAGSPYGGVAVLVAAIDAILPIEVGAQLEVGPFQDTIYTDPLGKWQSVLEPSPAGLSYLITTAAPGSLAAQRIVYVPDAGGPYSVSDLQLVTVAVGSIVLAPASVAHGLVSTATVTLVQAAPAAGVVLLTSGTPAVATVSYVLTFSAGTAVAVAAVSALAVGTSVIQAQGAGTAQIAALIVT